MVPFLFPHTHVEAARLDELLDTFEQIRLQRACDGALPAHLQAAAAAGRLRIDQPVSEDGTDIQGMVRAYRQWLEDTRGMDTRVRHLNRDTPPLFDDTSTARLRSQILSVKEGDPANGPDDSKRLAQLFLLTAEDWVAEMAALEADMDAHREKERALFAQLHGDPEASSMFTHTTAPERLVDPCSRMTPEWISAWCRLVSAHSDITGVWITFSDAVVAWMREVFDDARTIGTIPRGRKDLGSQLENILEQASTGAGGDITEQEFMAPDVTGGDAPVAVYQFPGVSPRDAANRLMHPGKPALPSHSADRDCHLVLIRWFVKS